MQLGASPWTPSFDKVFRADMSLRLPPGVLGLAFFAVIAPHSAGAAGCKFDKPDLSVAGIKLMDAVSATSVVGPDVEIKEVEDDLPNARFVTKDGAQELVVFSNYSAAGDEFSEFEVKMAGSEAMTLPDLPLAAFKSERGIELGISARDLVQKLGTCTKARERTQGGEFIQYEITYDQMGADLRALGFPTYFAEYEFQNDKLIRFRFGLERAEQQ